MDIRRKISILIIITLILNITINLLGNISLATGDNEVETRKKNPESCWDNSEKLPYAGTNNHLLLKLFIGGLLISIIAIIVGKNIK